MSSISVVIYGFNEKKNFPFVVKELVDVLRNITDHFEIILVDDGSSDETKLVFENLGQEYSCVRSIVHAQRSGIGTCLKDGFYSAKGELITFLPADGQINPKDLERFVDLMGGSDVVCSYYNKKPFSLLRKVMSKSVRLFVLILFGPSPRIEGSYMFKRNVLEQISLFSTSFAVNFEFVIKAYRKGFKFRFFETDPRTRLSGHSKVVNFDTIWKVFIEIIKLRIKFSL